MAAAAQIPTLMANYEKNVLSRYTPCNAETRNEVVKALSEVHTELVLIHPFREGNGRVARILSIIMALQAGFQHYNREKERRIFCRYKSGTGEELRTDGKDIPHGYREDTFRFLGDDSFWCVSDSASLLAIDRVLPPVSIAVELATLVISAFQYLSES